MAPLTSPNAGSDDAALPAARAFLLSAVLERVGYAVWQAAECEDTLAHLVLIHIRDARGVGVNAGLKMLGAEQSRTFGNLLTELRQHGVFEQDIEHRLIALVGERNWLVHRAKRENRGFLHDLQRVEQVVRRIAAIADEATQLNSLLGAKLEEMVVQSGVSKATIDEEASALIAAWGYRD